AYWTEHLPSDLAPFIGTPLCILRAMYGYTYSCKLLYEEQAEFLLQFGFTSSVLPAVWFKHLPNNGILIILQYCDDLLCASTSPKALLHFKTMLAKRFSIQWEPRAHWYLQACIDSDSHGNITLDQTRYASAIVRHYLPNSDPTPSAQDLITYESPLPRDFKWSKSDSSSNHDAVCALDLRYQFCYCEAVGSLIYLSNTVVEELFAIRKACKYMHLPGQSHYDALLNLMHHLRCHPPKALKYYVNPMVSPLATLPRNAGHSELDPTFVWFSDSSWAHCDDSCSTGCHTGFLQGDPINFSSFVHLPVQQLSAEAESMSLQCH
ncbi:MAG: hypothetical protein LH647_11395, partial [Leptolyngbyaceae cyanobacterium CAN_BIN12]|nr:hypothetical protein [Leptolyngbyaceae cyanobacterium CAN_BIN12]